MVCNCFHPDRRIVQNFRIFCNQFLWHQRHIISCRIMIVRVGQSTTILKICMLHSKRFCPRIHPFYKFCFTSTDMFCHCHTRIISWCNDNTFYHRFYTLFFSFFKINLRTSHRFCISTGCHLIFKIKILIGYFIKNQKERHNFRNAGRRYLYIFFFFINNFSGRGFH